MPWKKLLKSTLSEKTLFFGLLFSIGLLFIQNLIPHEVDTAYHVGKILRIANGEFFKDPILGNKTIYPEVFHAFYALLYKFLPISTASFSKFIQISNYIFFLVSSFILLKPFFKNQIIFLLALCSLHLILQGSETRIIFIVSPFNLGLPLALVGIHYLFELKNSLTRKNLILLSLFSSLAINIWWFFFFPFSVLLCCFSTNKNFRGYFWKLKNFLLAAVVFITPCLYTLIHFISIWDIVKNYREFEHYKQQKPDSILHLLLVWFRVTITHGNYYFIVDFLKSFSFAKIKNLSSLFNLLCFLHFILMSATTYLATYLSIFKKRTFLKENHDIYKYFLLPTLIITLFSIWVLVPGGAPHLRRMQSISYIFFHICFFYIIEHFYFHWIAKYKFILSMLVTLSLCFSTLSEPNPKNFQLSFDDIKLLNFIQENHFQDEKRIFADENTSLKLLPHTILNTYTIYSRGGGFYFRQDPKLASSIFSSYFEILSPQPKNWKRILQSQDVNYMIFSKQSSNEMREKIRQARRFYSQKLETIFENESWVVLKFY